MSIIQSIVVAFQFLTRLYLPFNVEWNDKNLKQSLLFFPLVGFFIGSVLFFFMKFMMMIHVDNKIASIITLIVWISFTGAMHIDGLSDMFDGFFSMKDREKTLEIMKDSRVGAFGVLAIVILIITKLILINEIFTNFRWDYSDNFIIYAPLIARTIAGLTLAFYDTTQKKGLAYTFHSTKPGLYAVIGSILAILGTLYLKGEIIYAWVTGIIVTLFINEWAKKKIGGLSGDIYGAIVEIVETVSLGVMLWLVWY